ncbi:MAG: LLM class flavin-dependent oxidoreductase [Actinomycetales bacterium]|nr:LLM class flavin-dependent oxidoreductase [Actinomycetales bacterium]
MVGMKIGLMLPMGSDETRGVSDLLQLAVLSEDVGLDSLWVADHFFHRAGGQTSGIHEAWTLLTAVAALTARVDVGTLVLAVPFRNPALTAKMALELDEVSGGRLILGLGCGWHEPEFDALGSPFDHRVSRFEEALQIILPLLRGEEVTFAGRYHRASEAVLVPGPSRAGGPPVLIAAAGHRMLELTARHAHQYNSAWHGEPGHSATLNQRLETLREAASATGRDPSTLTLTAGVVVRFDDLPGGDAEGDDAEPAGPAHVVRGSATRIAEALAGYADLGVDHLIVHLDPPSEEAVRRLGAIAADARTRTPGHS